MIEFSSQINNKIGIHLRAAGEFVKVATQFTSKVIVINGGRQADGKSILGLASLAVPSGTSITIQIDGKDEQEARKAIETLIANNFYEDDLAGLKDEVGESE